MRHRNLLGVNVCATTYAEACAEIREAAVERRPFAVTALAVHGVMTGALDRVHRQRLNALDMIVPDGQPVRWGLNLLYGERLRDRVRGPRLMLEVCEMAACTGLKIGFYGNRASVLEELCDKLRNRFPGLDIAVCMPSRFCRVDQSEQEALARELVASGTEILFVGLGCPRQEVWVYENRERLPMPILAVGAALDVHADRLPPAPLWTQDYGFEWAFRLWNEPRRLWRRYLLLNPLYLMMLAAQKLRLRRYEQEKLAEPVTYEGYA